LRGETPKIIEFYGLPGTGKTSVADVLIDDMRLKGLKVKGRQDYEVWIKGLSFYVNVFMIIKTLFTILFNINLLLNYMLTTKSVESLNIKLFFFIFYKAFSLKAFKKKFKDDIILLDQFLMQDIWSLFVFSSSYKEEVIKAIVSCCSQTDCIFFFSLSSEINAKRLSQRSGGTSRFDSNSYKDALASLLANKLYTEEVYSYSLKGSKKYIVDSSLSIKKNVDVIYKKITGYLPT